MILHDVYSALKRLGLVANHVEYSVCYLGVVRPVAETAGCADQAAKARLVGRPRARLRCPARIWSGVRYPCRATSQVAL